MPYAGTPEEQRAARQAYDASRREQRRAMERARYAADPTKKQAADKRYRRQNAAKIRAYQRTWASKRRCKEQARRRAYRLAHPEKEQAYGRQYREEHREEIRAKGRGYVAEHKEEMAAYGKAHRQANPEHYRAKKKRRRALERHAPISNLTHAEWVLIQEVQDHCCAYCGKRCKGHLTQDHITPLSQGGSHTLHNVIGACLSCNSKKHIGPPLKPVQPLLL